MTHHAPKSYALLPAAVAASTICVGLAHANDISFISTAGKNTNACTLSAPCRSLQRAIRITQAGGEIRILDSGFFGNNATIRKSLTISGNGNTVLLGKPLVIRAAGAVVALRGLTLNSRGAPSDGIFVEKAATVHIEDCLIHGFRAKGIRVSFGGAEVFITGTIVRDSDAGLSVDNGSIARISNSTFTGNRLGVRINGGGTVETRGNNTSRGNEFDVINLGGRLATFSSL